MYTMKKSPKKASIFECTVCDFICKRNSDFIRHKSTRKHAKLCELNQNIAKNASSFECTICNHICSKKSDYIKHLATRKHVKQSTLNQKVAEFSVKIVEDREGESTKFACLQCNKEYKFKSSLWYHHKKCPFASDASLCNVMIEHHETPPSEEYTNSVVVSTNEKPSEYEGEFIEYDGEPGLNAQIIALLKHVLKKNAELSDQVIQFKTDVKIDVKEQLTEFVSNIQPNNFTTNNNNNNNHFNLNIFLNDKCKDAVNISDFIQSLHLTLDDLQTVVEKGFIMGNYQIIADKFNELGIYKRPIHCSDIKRETVYVRENNEWQKETSEHPLLHKLVTHVAHKVSQQCSFWHRENPDYLKSDEKKEQSLLIMNSVLGAGNGKSIAENKARIAKNVLEFVEIDKRSEAILSK